MITRTSVNELMNTFPPASIVLSTAGGFMAKVNARDYRKIPAHSKHSLEPALKSGVDYEFFTVEKRGNNDKKAEFDDGSLLHCLTLERNCFEQYYHVSANYDKTYEGNPHYFSNYDALKKRITEHNTHHRALKAEIAEAVKAHNKAASKSESTLIADYNALPEEHKTAKLTPAGEKKAAKQFLNAITLSTKCKTPAGELAKDSETLMQLLESFIKETFDEAHVQQLMRQAPAERVSTLISIAEAATLKLKSAQPADIIAYAPTALVEAYLTKAEQKKAIDAYNNQQKQNGLPTLNPKADVAELINSLEEFGTLPKELMGTSKVFLQKLPNIENKHPAGGVYSVAQVCEEYEKCYQSAPLLRPEMEEVDKKNALQAGKELVSPEQLEHAERIVDQVFKHERANKYLTLPGNVSELAFFWNEYVNLSEATVSSQSPETNSKARYKPVLNKAMADIVNLNYNMMADLKFVSTVEFDKMERDASRFNYHVQDAFYRRGFNKILSALPEGAQELLRFVFIFVEKDAPRLGKDEVKPVRIRVESYSLADITRAMDLVDAIYLNIERWEMQNSYEGFEDQGTIRVSSWQAKRENEYIANARKQALAVNNENEYDNYHSEPVSQPSSPAPESAPREERQVRSTARPSFDELEERGLSSRVSAA